MFTSRATFVTSLILILVRINCYCEKFVSCNSLTSEYVIKPSTNSCVENPCFTFQQFAERYNYSHNLSDKTVLRFSAGNHRICSDLIISSIKSFSIISESTDAIITCSNSTFEFRDVTSVQLTNLTFVGCGRAGRSNPVMKLSQCKISMCACRFINSTGRVVDASFSNITIEICNFRGSREGILTLNAGSMKDTGSSYELSVSKNTTSAIYFFKFQHR